MSKYRVLVECSNYGGTDIHCWSGIEAISPGAAELKAVEMARLHYPEFDEFEPVRVEEEKHGGR